MNKFSIILSSVILFSSCKTPFKSDSTPSATVDQNSIEETYSKAVNDGRFRYALELTCIKYNLKDCRSMKIVESDSVDHRATTSLYWYGNGITLYKNAFIFRKTPHMGWLAAIIRHEQVHQHQSSYIRWVQNIQKIALGDHTFDATLETEAWKEMIKYKVEYDLSCQQIMEIEQNLHYYGQILRNKGKKPTDKEAMIPTKTYKILFNQCLQRRKQSNDG